MVIGTRPPTRYRAPTHLVDEMVLVNSMRGPGLWTQTPYTHNHSWWLLVRSSGLLPCSVLLLVPVPGHRYMWHMMDTPEDRERVTNLLVSCSWSSIWWSRSWIWHIHTISTSKYWWYCGMPGALLRYCCMHCIAGGQHA